MKYGQKVYIPSLNEVGTIEEVVRGENGTGFRISKVNVKGKIIDVFYLVVENWDLITKFYYFIKKLFKK
ncbi:MAG: hypothetical protein IPN97_07550 [Saprospiraceae bacterium]|nr:hypothetical protein [Saprospiraceae bacterium]